MTLSDIKKKIDSKVVLSTKELQWLSGEAAHCKGVEGKYDWDELDRKAAFGYPFTRDEIFWLYEMAESKESDFSDVEVTPVLGLPGWSAYAGYLINNNVLSPGSSPPITVTFNSTSSAPGCFYKCLICGGQIDGVVNHASCVGQVDQSP
jgi:hypothetical protein